VCRITKVSVAKTWGFFVTLQSNITKSSVVAAAEFFYCFLALLFFTQHVALVRDFLALLRTNNPELCYVGAATV